MDPNEIEQLDEATCWSLLAEHRVGRLAVSVANRPDIFPVNYLLAEAAAVSAEDRSADPVLMVRTAPGFKLAAATLGNGVAFEVDRLDEAARTGWSVVVHGRAEEIKSLDELLASEDLGIDPWAGGRKNRFIRILADEVTGRRIVADRAAGRAG